MRSDRSPGRRTTRHRLGITIQDRGASDSTLVLGNVIVAGHRTSVRLEPAIWDALQDILQREAKTLNQLVTEIDRARTASSLTAAIRVFVVRYYRDAIRELTIC
jgi:predicted DNA-binding ribbon-helix-helix protein